MENRSPVDTARAFLAAIAAGESVERFLAPDVVQVDYPNKLLPNGETRDFRAICAAQEKGRKVLSSQTFDVVNVVASDHCVVLETVWIGHLAIALGTLSPGAVIRARFAQVFEFRDGKIVHLRNYDCFEPW